MPEIDGIAVRARDLRVNIKEMGYEKGMAHTLELALEELSTQRVAMRQAVELIGMLTERLDELMTIGAAMSKGIDELRRARESEQ